MINGITGMMGLGILFITVLLCRYSYWLGMKKGVKQRDKDITEITSELIGEDDE